MTDITLDQVHAALREIKDAKGQPAVRELLNRIAGVNSARDLDENQYAAVIAACRGGSPGLVRNGALDAAAIFAKWNSAGKRTTP